MGVSSGDSNSCISVNSFFQCPILSSPTYVKTLRYNYQLFSLSRTGKKKTHTHSEVNFFLRTLPIFLILIKFYDSETGYALVFR